MLLHKLQSPRQSKTLMVVFSQARIPAGKFGLERLFAKTQHACLFVNHAGSLWYLGVDDELDQRIDAAVEAFAPERLIYYGASMGAYGALKTGLRRRDGEIFAFGPEFELGAPGTQSRDTVGPKPEVPDYLPDGLAGDLAYPVHLFFGLYDWIDAKGYQTLTPLKERSNINLYGLKSPHASHDHLYTINVVRQITKRFDRDIPLIINNKNISYTMNRREIELFIDLGEAIASELSLSGKLNSECEEMLLVTHPGYALLGAEVLSRRGETKRAVSLLRRWENQLSTDPVLASTPKRWRKRFPLERVRIELAAGELETARTSLSEMAARYPICEHMLSLSRELGMSLEAYTTD
ncbi:hypothetical protein [Pseudovibrio sp. SPO723]|uniref:hypothetical protein n=1 Tax=Nesiotobacter zosterae TaxID=392721 RepID=UPI0029C549D4|nr:hypothetical protein [Pseudovibrio sp. SPO723]MDX5595058.1 hypothetical protein [Pseudovibrio sp. SPO723]